MASARRVLLVGGTSEIGQAIVGRLGADGVGALCLLGVPSPYWTIAFPNRPPQGQEYLDFEGVPPRAVARWKL